MPGTGATPVPASAIVCGDPEALSEIETDAASAPAAAGVKPSEIVQLAPMATVAPQLLDSVKLPAFAPLNTIPETESAALPVLVSVIVCTALDNPTVCALNVTIDAESPAPGFVAGVDAAEVVLPQPIESRQTAAEETAKQSGFR
jgi:hypothetical protein